MDEKYYTSEEVAAILQLSPKTIDREARNHNIRAYKLARKWRFKKVDIEDWISKSLNKGRP